MTEKRGKARGLLGEYNQALEDLERLNVISTRLDKQRWGSLKRRPWVFGQRNVNVHEMHFNLLKSKSINDYTRTLDQCAAMLIRGSGFYEQNLTP